MHSSTFSPPHTHLVNFFRFQAENHLFRGLPKSESIQSESEVAQSCPTLCDPMDPTPPGSSVHGIFQARTLEWVAISFSRRSSRPRDWTWVSSIISRHLTIWATREDLSLYTITKRCRYSLVFPFIWSDFRDLRYLVLVICPKVPWTSKFWSVMTYSPFSKSCLYLCFCI